MEINIYKVKDNVCIKYGEIDELLSFEALSRFSKELVYNDEYKNKKIEDFSVKTLSGDLKLYEETILELIRSIKSDEKLLELLMDPEIKEGE